MLPPPSSLDEPFPPANSTAVAIDRNKNSQSAVRWAIDHLIIICPVIILIHVKLKHDHGRGRGHGHGHGHGHGDDETDANQIFAPFRGYCARKGVEMKEVLLEDTDVARAILDYISKNFINNLVVGATSRNAFARLQKFRCQEMPTNLVKLSPEYCSVYVINKGKIVTVRTAHRPPSNSITTPRASTSGDSDGSSRGHRTKGRADKHSADEPLRGLQIRMGSNVSADSIELLNHGRSSTGRFSAVDESDVVSAFGLGSVDISVRDLDFSVASVEDSTPHSLKDVESEMRRLRLELKRTMELYSSACKEALSAKKKASELHCWKLGESQRLEEAKLAEEAALQLAEIEKAKCRAAMEAADAAQKIAEMEAQRRRKAEIKAKQEADEKQRSLTALHQGDNRYRKYSIEEIEEATEKFADTNKIGEGGYGPVYKARLDHTPVAIKILRPDAAQGQKQFHQEVEVLCTIRHPHMVLLLGACPDYCCLVYEYLNNGSLEDRLFRRGKTAPLSWRMRFRIASEIATALLFLHQAKPEPLVHRDLKPANILLDRNYVSKISDVGLARLVPPSVADSVTQFRMTSAAGTFCYIDPEYQQTGKLTTKSDIYSLGVMLLQIITGKSPMGLAHLVNRAIEKGTFEEMLDPSVEDWPVEETLSYAKLALKCAELRKKDRPDLATEVLPELNRLKELGKRVDEE